MTTTTKTAKTPMAARRAMAAAAAVAGIGTTAVTLPAAPATAHETRDQLGASTAAVGAGHAGIRVCGRDRGYVAQVRWYSPGQSTQKVIGAVDGQCYSYVDPDGVARWRLCLAPGGGCNGWKDA